MHPRQIAASRNLPASAPHAVVAPNERERFTGTVPPLTLEVARSLWVLTKALDPEGILCGC